MKEWRQPEIQELNIMNTEDDRIGGTHPDGHYAYIDERKKVPLTSDCCCN